MTAARLATWLRLHAASRRRLEVLRDYRATSRGAAGDTTLEAALAAAREVEEWHIHADETAPASDSTAAGARTENGARP